MTRLPLIVGFGGVGPAGRSSFHHAYRRTIIESTSGPERQRTFLALASMMNLIRFSDGQYVGADGQKIEPTAIEARYGQQILASTLIRRIEPNLFDPDRVPGARAAARRSGTPRRTRVRGSVSGLRFVPTCLQRARVASAAHKGQVTARPIRTSSPITR